MIVTWYCATHNITTLDPCPFCMEAAKSERDAVNILEARIADLEADVMSLRRQMTEIRHIALDVQRAHNAIVPHIPINPDLLP